MKLWACGDNEWARESASLRGGVFTTSLLEEWEEARRSRGEIRVDEGQMGRVRERMRTHLGGGSPPRAELHVVPAGEGLVLWGAVEAVPPMSPSEPPPPRPAPPTPKCSTCGTGVVSHAR